MGAERGAFSLFICSSSFESAFLESGELAAGSNLALGWLPGDWWLKKERSPKRMNGCTGSFSAGWGATPAAGLGPSETASDDGIRASSSGAGFGGELDSGCLRPQPPNPKLVRASSGLLVACCSSGIATVRVVQPPASMVGVSPVFAFSGRNTRLGVLLVKSPKPCNFFSLHVAVGLWRAIASIIGRREASVAIHTDRLWASSVWSRWM